MKSYFATATLYVGRPGLVRSILDYDGESCIAFREEQGHDLEPLPCTAADGAALSAYLVAFHEAGAPDAWPKPETTFRGWELTLQAPESYVYAIAIIGNHSDICTFDQREGDGEMEVSTRTARELIAHLSGQEPPPAPRSRDLPPGKHPDPHVDRLWREYKVAQLRLEAGRTRAKIRVLEGNVGRMEAKIERLETITN